LGAEVAYASKLGVKLKQPDMGDRAGIAAHREALLGALRAGADGKPKRARLARALCGKANCVARLGPRMGDRGPLGGLAGLDLQPVRVGAVEVVGAGGRHNLELEREVAVRLLGRAGVGANESDAETEGGCVPGADALRL